MEIIKRHSNQSRWATPLKISARSNVINMCAKFQLRSAKGFLYFEYFLKCTLNVASYQIQQYGHES